MFAYIGCRTTRERNARGRGIAVYKITNGKWQLIQEELGLENPSYLTFDKSKNFLYSVHGDLTKVSAYKILANGCIQHLNTVDAQGKNPVFITPSKNNKYAFVATLQGGSVVTLGINANGSLSEPLHIQKLAGIGEAGITHAHQCLLDVNEEFLFVPTQGRHIGYERVYVFKIDNDSGELRESCIMPSRQYSEPRHIAISPCNRRAYLINEKGNAVTYCAYDDKSGSLEARQIISSLPETYTGEGQASAILMHKSGRFVYASNRIHESIAMYSVDECTGYLKNIGFTPVMGRTPRFMTFNSDDNQLLVANEDSDSIEIFSVNPDNGTLIHTGQSIKTPSPTCIIFKDMEE